MATTYAGEIITRFGADLSGLQRGFSQAQSMGRGFSTQMQTHTESVSRGFGGMGRSILAAGAGIGGWVFAIKTAGEAAIGLGKAMFQSSMDMEQTRVAFVGLTGSGKEADAMMRRLQDFAKTTPFEFPELAKDAQLLMGVGVAANDVIPTMTAIGDAAAKMGLSSEGVDRVTVAITQMIAKGKISADEMMQLTEARIPAWNILAKSMGLSVAQLTDMGQKGQLTGDAIKKLISGMEVFGKGEMQRQMGTMAGQLSNVKDAAGQAWRAFVSPLFEAAKTGIGKLAELLGSQAFQNFASGAATAIATAMKRIGDFIGPVITGISALIGSITSGKGDMGGFASTLLDLGDVFMPLFLQAGQQISTFVTGSLIPAIKGLQPTFSAIGNLFVSIIPYVVRVIQIFLQVSNTIRGVVLTAFSAFLPVIVNIVNTVAGFLIPAIKFIAPYVMEAANAFGQFVSQVATLAIPLLKQLAGTITGIVTIIRTVFIAVWPTLGPIVGAAFQVVVNVIKVAWSIISGIIKIALNLLKGDWGAAWNSLKDMLGGVWDGIKGIISNALGVILGILGGILGAVGSVFQGIWNKASEIWGNIWKTITGFVSNIWKSVTDFMGRIFHAVVDPWQPVITFMTDVMRILWGIISTGWNVIWGAISGFLSKIWNTITTVWNTISSFIGNIITTIWNAEVRGWTNIWNTVSSFLSRIWGTISSIWTNIRNFIGNILGTILSNVSNIWNTVWGTISRFANNIWNTVTTIFGRIRDTVGGIFRGMINNIIAWLNPGLRKVQDFLNFFIGGINKVSQFFIKKDLLPYAKIGPIGYLAQGTKDWRGGVAMVGERGPEIVYLPQHARVFPNEETERLVRVGQAPIPNFEQGLNVGGGIGDILGDVFNAITGNITGLVTSLLKNIFSGAPDLGIFSEIAGSLLGRVAGFLGDWVKNNIGSLMTTFTGNLPMAQQGNFILPRGGGYGALMWYGRHQGADYAFPQGTPLHEVAGGMVLPHTGWYDWGGEVDVMLAALPGLWERYLHLSQIFVKAGQFVKRGDLIGLTGGGTPASGLGYWSHGAHLHIQYDRGSYQSSYDPLAVWSALGIFKPFRKGGILREPVVGMGLRTGGGYSFGESGPEAIVPIGAGGGGGGGGTQGRMIDLLERIERLLSQDSRVTEYQITQALGKLLAQGVR